MEKVEKKFYQSMNNEQTADFLRQLASSIEEGNLELGGENFEWTEIKKIKVTFKNQDSRLLVKTKLKSEFFTDTEMESEGETGDPAPLEIDVSFMPYKKLKKRMKKSLTDIHKDISGNQLPSEADVKLFADDCVAMTKFNGYGDENYSGFLEKVKQMTEAFSLNDQEKFRQAFSGLLGHMKACHDRYK